MEDSHSYHEERKGTHECEEIAPEMICQSISTFCYISSDNSCKEDSKAIQCQDTPIWEGVLREIPVCQSVDKEGYFHLVQHPI